MLSLLNHQKTYFRIWCSGVEGHFFPISLNQFREGPCLLYIHPFGYADAVSSAQTTSLVMWRSQLCMKNIQKLHNISHQNHLLLPNTRGHTHDYNLRTRTTSSTKAFDRRNMYRTKRSGSFNFITFNQVYSV